MSGSDIVARPTPAPQRVTCDVTGRPKLLAEITPAGITVWCRICHRAHLIPCEVVIAAWQRGVSVLHCEVAPSEQRV
ncbi:MAG: hypothetical protein H0W02_10100 [Ktedonobacteraceae bacterium]|nr:hypothetical protein [Ktedonobacteraceae bacterium]